MRGVVRDLLRDTKSTFRAILLDLLRDTWSRWILVLFFKSFYFNRYLVIVWNFNDSGLR